MSIINRYDDYNEDFDNDDMMGKVETSDEEGLSKLASLNISKIMSFIFFSFFFCIIVALIMCFSLFRF